MPTEKTTCLGCKKRPTCREVCDDIERLLDSPDRARPRTDIPTSAAAEIDEILELALSADIQTRAMTALYFRGGFSLREIGRAFGIGHSTVIRRIRSVRDIENKPGATKRSRRNINLRKRESR